MTPELDDFLARYEQDDNEWWRLASGHHQNLFEAAVDRMQAAERLLHDIAVARRGDCPDVDEQWERLPHEIRRMWEDINAPR